MNGLGKNSSTNAVVLAIAWIGLVVVMPAMVNVAAEAMFPVPSQVSFVNEQRMAVAEATEKEAETMADFLGDHPELALIKGEGVNYAMKRVVRDLAVSQKLSPVIQAQQEQIVNQQALVKRWSFLSPAMLVYGLQLDASGTSTSRHHTFFEQLRTFRGIWHSFFETKYFEWKPIQPEVYDQVPQMEYHEEPIGAVLQRAFLPLAGLVLFIFITLVGILKHFRNWRVMVLSDT